MIKYSSFLNENSFTIFLFHGVISNNIYNIRNYARKHITKETFTQVIKDLFENGNPISMNSIIEANKKNKDILPRSFTITFDDGFENNYSIAAPILEEFNIPATFYITKNFIENNNSSWMDMIEYAFESVDKFEIKFKENRLLCSNSQEKIVLLNQIRSFVKNNPAIDPYKFALDIWHQLSIKKMQPDQELDQKMNWQQVKTLSKNRLFTIGGHSHTHRILEFLPDKELRNEIDISIDVINKKLDNKIVHYSYPEGLKNCYSDRVISLLKDKGILCAPSAEHGVNKIGDDLFNLKRIMVT